MNGERHCDLCDLLSAQCAHGLARRQRRAETKAKAKKAQQKSLKGQSSKPPSHRPVLRKRREKLPEVLKGVPVVTTAQPVKAMKKCVKCGKGRYRTYNVCARCLRATNGRDCARCGKFFLPPAKAKEAKKCASCSGRTVRFYEVTTAGSPRLGKRT